MSVEEIEELANELIEYFEKHPERKWNNGKRMLSFRETAELMRRDKNFRKTILSMVCKYAVAEIMKGEQ